MVRDLRVRLLAAALAYASRGWYVFPLWPGSKAPAVPDGWQRRATCDPHVIRRMWAGRPFNIAIACGPSRLVVVDLDVPKTGRQGAGCSSATSATSATVQVNPVADTVAVADRSATDGRRAFLALCARQGQRVPADTFTVATGGGGLHLYYRQPGGQPGGLLRNSAGKLGALIDTRGDGGYVVAAPSMVQGRAYTVRRDTPPMVLPDWLADRLAAEPEQAPVRQGTPVRVRVPADRRGAYLAAALNRELELVSQAHEGTRNKTLFTAAMVLGQLVAGGALSAESVSVLLEQAGVSTGLRHDECARTIASGLRIGARRPRTVTP